MKLVRRDIIFSGQVQGVGFRFTATQVARRFDVTGWVMNMPDRTVRMVVEGTVNEIDQFLDAVCDETHGRVTNRRIERKPATGTFSGFAIQH